MINLAERHLEDCCYISGIENVDAAITSIIELETSIEDSTELSCSLGEAIRIEVENIERYEDTYQVQSKPFQDYTLSTKDKMMVQDITVKKISTYEVSNEYGTTINIGG